MYGVCRRVKPMICDSCGGDIEYGEEFYLFEGDKFCRSCYDNDEIFDKRTLFEAAGGKVCCHEEDYD